MAKTFAAITSSSRAWAIVCIGVFLTGCTAAGGGEAAHEGGQTGDEDAVPQVPVPFGPASQDTACPTEDTPTELKAIDEVTPGGFAPSDVLRYAEGNFKERLQWNERPESFDWAPTHKIAPRADEDMVSIEITYSGGGLRYFPPIDVYPSANTVCRGILEIDVRVSVKATSGAFDEKVDAVLTAPGPAWGQIWLAFHSASIEPVLPLPYGGREDVVALPPVYPLAGELAISSPYGGGETLGFVEISLSLSELGINGRIGAWMYSSKGGRLAPDIGTIGDVCPDGYGFPLAPDAPVPGKGETPSSEDALAVLNEMQWVGVRDDNTQVPLTLNFEYTDGSACARPGDDRTPLRLDATLFIDARLAAGQVDGQWPVALHVRTDASGGLEGISIRLVLFENPSIDALESDWGVTGLDTSGYDEASITFDLQLEVESGIPSASGELTVRAYVQPPGDRPVAETERDILEHLIIEAATEA